MRERQKEKWFMKTCMVAWLGMGLGSMLMGQAPASGNQELRLDLIQLPPGFQINVYARGVSGARSMTRGSEGTLFVGSRGDGAVYAVLDRDGDQQAEEVLTLVTELNTPNGVAFRDGDLYVAETHRVWRYRDIESHLRSPPQPELILDNLPKDRRHSWRFIAFGPDGWLYVPVGAPCNACRPADERYASMLRMRPDGTGLEVFARGIRNTVGFDWRPETEELWFTDNGRDWLGDDRPPDELNRATGAGLHFGYPYCHGGDIPDPEFGQERGCQEFTPPARNLGPHVAAIGMRFYTGDMFPEEYRNQILIAEHGSWNRAEPLGYRLSLVRQEKGQVTAYEVFAEGWLQGGRPWGRPVDVLVMPDGALLVSDNQASVIYRITYQP
jgi:glucose/arabinose dehydrogenase